MDKSCEEKKNKTLHRILSILTSAYYDSRYMLFIFILEHPAIFIDGLLPFGVFLVRDSIEKFGCNGNGMDSFLIQKHSLAFPE